MQAEYQNFIQPQEMKTTKALWRSYFFTYIHDVKYIECCCKDASYIVKPLFMLIKSHLHLM